MLIAATGDIHSPVNYDMFVKEINNIAVQPDLFLIAGDLIDRNATRESGPFKELRKVSNAMFGKINCPIFACFGNNEFLQHWDQIREENPEIKFLQDESVLVEVNGQKVGIVGSKGSLDRPTWWQRNNIPGIAESYTKRIDKVAHLLAKLKADYKILLIHYPPTYKILGTENPRSHPELACGRMEKVLIEQDVDLVITGHAHRGRKEAWVDGVPVLNVGLTLNEGIVEIDPEELKPGLEKFF
jgi:Icc-related predicted phosphoesterase